MNTDYSQFYKGTSRIPTYGNGEYGKDTVARYEFNTTNEKGEKIREKMSREETMQAMNDISKQYGENVIVEFSGDGLAALVESRKPFSQKSLSKDAQAENNAKQAEFDKEVVSLDRKANDLPAYSGLYQADKAIASALENSSEEEKSFVYDIVRQNFLISDSSSMTEEERQANISLGMKKAEYAANNFISEDHRGAFLDAMESIAKLAAAGKPDESGTMNYGVNKANYLGHGSNLVYTTDGLDMMRTMDSAAYTEYQKISQESSNEDRPLNTLKYLTNWYTDAVKKNPKIIDQYGQQSEEHVEEKVKNQKLDSTFLSSILKKELSQQFWQ